VTQLKILQKCQGLFHADEAIYLETHVCNRPARVQVTHDVLRDHIQAWSLRPQYRKKNIDKVSLIRPVIIICILIEVAYYLVRRCFYDPNREGEEEGKGTCQQNTPPWQLELFNVIFASKYGDGNVSNKDADEPPLRDLLVSPHKLCVDIHPFLLES
jgi:hypothetical protein